MLCNNEFKVGNQVHKVWYNQKGYACVTVYDRGKRRAYLLHRVVWETAHGPLPQGYEVHHLDFDRSNWQLGNLLALDRRSHRKVHDHARPTV